LNLDVKAREYVACRELGPAAGIAKVDGLARKLIERANVGVGTHCDVHLLTKQLGDVDDLAVETADLVAAPKRVEQIGRGDTQVYALEEANVADVLGAALADEG